MSNLDVQRWLETDSLSVRHVRCARTWRHRRCEECAQKRREARAATAGAGS